MPNNNPHGHNQYTKPELRSQRSKKPAATPSSPPHSEAPQSSGTPQGRESHDSHGSSHESSRESSEGSRPDAAGADARGGNDPGVMLAGATRDGASPAARPSGTSRRGFASMDAALQREIASKGGHSQGRENNPGNFANDRQRAREAGRKGGEAHGHR